MGITSSENSYLLLKSFSNYGIYIKQFTLNSGINVLAVISENRPYYLPILFLFLFTIIRSISISTWSLLIGPSSFFTTSIHQEIL